MMSNVLPRFFGTQYSFPHCFVAKPLLIRHTHADVVWVGFLCETLTHLSISEMLPAGPSAVFSRRALVAFITRPIYKRVDRSRKRVEY